MPCARDTEITAVAWWGKIPADHRVFRHLVHAQGVGTVEETEVIPRPLTPVPDVRTLVTAIVIQRETGGNLAEILEKVAYVIRERFRLRRHTPGRAFAQVYWNHVGDEQFNLTKELPRKR